MPLSRSQVSDIIWVGLGADLAPSISQSVIFCRSGMFMAVHLRPKFSGRQGESMVVELSLLLSRYTFATPRRDAPELCIYLSPPLRAWGMPGARCTRGLACTLHW